MFTEFEIFTLVFCLGMIGMLALWVRQELLKTYHQLANFSEIIENRLTRLDLAAHRLDSASEEINKHTNDIFVQQSRLKGAVKSSQEVIAAARVSSASIENIFETHFANFEPTPEFLNKVAEYTKRSKRTGGSSSSASGQSSPAHRVRSARSRSFTLNQRGI